MITNQKKIKPIGQRTASLNKVSASRVPPKNTFEQEIINKTKELSEDKIVQSLKPRNSLDDITRNLLIEESKTRNLESDEIQYLMNDEYYRNKKPSNTPKIKPFKNIAKEIRIDPTPASLTPQIHDPVAVEQKRRFDAVVREIEQEKLNNRTKGLAGLLGGEKAYV